MTNFMTLSINTRTFSQICMYKLFSYSCLHFYMKVNRDAPRFKHHKLWRSLNSDMKCGESKNTEVQFSGGSKDGTKGICYKQASIAVLSLTWIEMFRRRKRHSVDSWEFASKLSCTKRFFSVLRWSWSPFSQYLNAIQNTTFPLFTFYKWGTAVIETEWLAQDHTRYLRWKRELSPIFLNSRVTP